MTETHLKIWRPQIHQQIEEQQETLKTQQESLTELQTELQAKQTELQAKAEETSTNLEEVSARLEQARADEAARLAEEEKQQSQETSSGSVSGGGGYDNSVINGGGSSATADALTLFAALLDCEAIYDYDAMLAVATVIMNRVESPRFGNSITSVIYASGQFEPVWSGRLDAQLEKGPSPVFAMQVAQDAVNGARLAAVSDCYYFLYAPSTNRDGINIGNNLFFTSW